MKHLSSTTWIITVDGDGKQIGPAKVVRVPEPDHVSSNGFDHIPEYLDRVIASQARFTSLGVFTASLGVFNASTRGFGIYKRGTTIEILPSSNSSSEPKIRAFFETRSLTPSRDYLASQDTTRILHYPLILDGAYCTELSLALLREVYDVSPTEALDFTYQEQE